MLESINHITIDVSDPLTTHVVKAVQEDIRSRYIEITLVSNGAALEIPANTHGMIGIRRPNGTHVLYDYTEDNTPAITIDGNVVTIYLSQEALAMAGRMYTSVSLYSGSIRLTAFHFIVDVEVIAVPSDVVVESDYFNVLEGLVADVIDAADRAEAAAAQVGDPVAYTPQSRTAAEQAQARQKSRSIPEFYARSVDPASTTQAGIVQLYDGVDSSSTSLAATANAVRKAFENRGVNPNILDNGYLIDPINQRGQSSYVGQGYGIDRWKSVSTNLTVTVGSSYIQLDTSAAMEAGYRILDQILPELADGTYTVSIRVTAISGSFALFFGSQSDATKRVYTEDFSASGLYTVTGEVSGITDPIVSIVARSDGAASLRTDGIKLERGTSQTLCALINGEWEHRTIPNRPIELLRCQRYQYVLLSGTANGPMGYGYGGSATLLRMYVQLPTPMIGTPSVTFLSGSASSLVTIPNVTSISAVSSVFYQDGSCYLNVNLTASGATLSQLYILRRNTADILFDANL